MDFTIVSQVSFISSLFVSITAARSSRDHDAVYKVYGEGIVDDDAPLSGETLGDNTKPFPWADDTFDLVLGRGARFGLLTLELVTSFLWIYVRHVQHEQVICLCETNKSDGPCGVPENLEQFVREVARVLRRHDG